jgi:hypothetical protein
VLREEENDYELEDMAGTILTNIDIDMETMEFLVKGKLFPKDPQLEATYYHLCSFHRNAFVLNDELLNHGMNDDVSSWLEKLIGPPIAQDDTVICQESAAAHDWSIAQIPALPPATNYIIITTRYTITYYQIYKTIGRMATGQILHGTH